MNTSITNSRKVDVVYTWVDGSDPVYFETRVKYQPDLPRVDKSRFRDNGEIKYSIRSLLKNAIFVGKIYIVTNNQFPSFLKISHPRIEIVDCDQLISSCGITPNFNSMAIECRLHEIPGLSEDFIYLNDDFFLGRNIDLFQLTNRDGAGLFLMEKRSLSMQSVESYQSYLESSNRAIGRFFGDAPRFNGCHVPHLFNKEVCKKVYSMWYNEINKTLHSRFREGDNVVFRLLYAYFCIYNISSLPFSAMPQATNKEVSRFASNDDYCWIPFGDYSMKYREIMHSVINSPPMFFCVQDHLSKETSASTDELRKFLESLFPEPSEVEL